MNTNRVCFFIAPIGEEESEIRKRSDQVLRHIVAPTAGKFDYTVVRADQIDKPGLITSQVIQHVIDSALVVADLAGFNPNVFYELALRHAVRKAFVQIAAKGQKLPFDVAGLRTIFLNHNDLDSVDQCKKELESQIKSISENPEGFESPISVAVNVQALRDSSRPLENSLAEMMGMLQGLSQQVRDLSTVKLLSSPVQIRYGSALTNFATVPPSNEIFATPVELTGNYFTSVDLAPGLQIEPFEAQTPETPASKPAESKASKKKE